MSADNQQGSHSKPQWFWIDPSETIRRTPLRRIYQAYLQGALHDGTYNKFHKTFRFTQGNLAWLRRLKSMFEFLGINSWIYKEGRLRNVFALETTASFLQIGFNPLKLLTEQEKIVYIRGYFDAEGGIPKNNKRWYVQFVQKDFQDLQRLQFLLKKIGIQCGNIHNPSYKIAPRYWRFYILRASHRKFNKLIGSWHPRKSRILLKRMMI